MPGPERPDGAPWRNFYGRRRGKTLRKTQAAALEAVLETHAVTGAGWAENPERRALDLPALFGRAAPVWLEIGFGSGEHLHALAGAHREVNLIGCEPFVNGVATLAAKIAASGATNIRIHPGDARDLFDVIPAAALQRIYLLYPDPWPKTKHHRRRFMSAANIEPLARCLAPGGELRVATDIADYVRQALAVTTAEPRFEWLAERPEDWRAPWRGWTGTRYEAKALREGRRPHYLRFRRTGA